MITAFAIGLTIGAAFGISVWAFEYVAHRVTLARLRLVHEEALRDKLLLDMAVETIKVDVAMLENARTLLEEAKKELERRPPDDADWWRK